VPTPTPLFNTSPFPSHLHPSRRHHQLSLSSQMFDFVIDYTGTGVSPPKRSYKIYQSPSKLPRNIPSASPPFEPLRPDPTSPTKSPRIHSGPPRTTCAPTVSRTPLTDLSAVSNATAKSRRTAVNEAPQVRKRCRKESKFLVDAWNEFQWTGVDGAAGLLVWGSVRGDRHGGKRQSRRVKARLLLTAK
jgi:hypothetical protein